MLGEDQPAQGGGAEVVDANGEPLPMKTWDDFYKFSEKLTKKDGKTPGN